MIEKGQKINDRYEIISLIGDGGMADVYLAKDSILNRKVALKVLRQDLNSNHRFVVRFEKEALAASKLIHHNIVSIYDVLEYEGRHFIVMEYVEGKTLKQLVQKRGKLTLPEVIDIMIQLTSGIKCAHDSLIIHRDIKPQNILILDNGTVKIADFGIAVALNESEMTQTNSVMGSVYYLPPEQASGDSPSVKGDIYSLGIVMYELLIGSVPFKGETAVEIALKHLQEDIPNVRDINPLIPQLVENIILKSTAKNLKNRYNSIDEMISDLKEVNQNKKEDVKRVEFEFDEETKSKNMPKKDEIDDDFKDDEEKSSKLIYIISGIIMTVLIIIVALAIFFTDGFKTPDVTVPNVMNTNVIVAEKTLRDAGLSVNLEIVNESSDEVDEGQVIRTEPAVDRTVKKGTMVTIYVSTGTNKITLEDYTNLDYAEVKAKLELLGINVEKKLKTVENKEEYLTKANNILEQNPVASTKVEKNSTVYLYLPDVELGYPDMVKEGWDEADVRAWAEDYDLIITYDYKEDNNNIGKVLSQSRLAGSKIVSKATFKVVIGQAVTDETGTKVEEEKPEENNNSNNEESDEETNSLPQE